MEVQEIMTTKLTTVRPEQLLGDLMNLFNEVSYHHMPVTKDNKLLGIISDRDVSKNLSPFIDTHKQRPEDAKLLKKSAADIMSRDLVTIDKTTSVDCASILLLENNISCLPVVDENMLLEGLLTWKDILSYHVYHDE